MARAAVPGGLKVRRAWRAARLVERRTETATASTLVLEVPGWPGHLAGQHVDVRLTAPDGYQAARSYSLAAPANGDQVEITVQRVPDGEVSSYLVDVATSGDSVEVRGPVGGWFVWKPEDRRPVLLVAGGSGVVPLMAMVRSRDGVSPAPFRLVYSVRTPEDRFYDLELRRRVAEDAGLEVSFAYTRRAPEGEPRPVGRISADDLVSHGWPVNVEPTCYVCGPTAFVEAVSDWLVGLGHDPARIRTERFGPSGS
jgi:ferredoxin-NADP reductase